MIIIIEAGAVCEARVPVAFKLGTLLMMCGQPAGARHVYTCPFGHEVDAVTCPEHTTPLEQVGCARCLTQDYRQTQMISMREVPV